MPPSDLETAETLMQEGWSHFRLQRPLAAWASWRRALGFVPEFAAARQALEGLQKAPELPAAAKSVLRFQPPREPTQRKRWDELFRGCDMEDLADASEAFSALAREDPADRAAWYNAAVCLAWQGRNPEAVEAFDHVVALDAADRPDATIEAWTIAEVLRQGGGAESLADDMAYAWVVHCPDDDAEQVLAHWPGIQPVPPPVDPATGQPQFPDARAYTWLDRAHAPDLGVTNRVSDLPRVLAQVLNLPGALRLSSPDADSLDRVFSELMAAFGELLVPLKREATPLPLPLLDAAVWTFRIPPGLEPETSQRLAREAVEHYYENMWINTARHGLDDRSPLEAARAAQAGDAVARVKLAAVVRLREQLGQRPWTAELYHGYPFDRLRRRLGLELHDPEYVEPADYSCMSEQELSRVDPTVLEDSRLADAYESAAGLGDDRLTARFAAELARRDSPSLSWIDAPSLIATLVREAMKSDASDEALDWLDQARLINRGRDRRTYDVWAAEIYARTGAPAAASQAYQELLDQDPSNAALALDAAETLIDNGYVEHARPFLDQAVLRARQAGDHEIARRVEALLAQAPGSPSDT
jgi:tetratricopeptide (TPR) repeat protein